MRETSTPMRRCLRHLRNIPRIDADALADPGPDMRCDLTASAPSRRPMGLTFPSSSWSFGGIPMARRWPMEPLPAVPAPVPASPFPWFHQHHLLLSLPPPGPCASLGVARHSTHPTTRSSQSDLGIPSAVPYPYSHSRRHIPGYIYALFSSI
ncbi:hypothetical protein FB451DRAFT_1204786 [Mycena latifolia]|nr:hypothetical protein FB451DRAFT_1204786 [Mycena latifolia]